ncbi:MAG: ROK family protein [Acidimicrobiia bacterium]|nr:ROK family protein [Acidimicrobiia bacterium]MCY4457907.1 ROK family transcriptional regulator [Acidimicrobiaceae bacterium]
MNEASGSGVLRLLSGQRIVDALFAAHPQQMSRAGIARTTGLSKPTVSALMSDMENAGLVRVATESPKLGSLGRPAALYELVPTVRHTLVADVGATKMLIGISDLFGNLVTEREIETGADARSAFTRLIDTSTEMLRSFDSPPSCACIGVPGIYRRAQDRVEQALNLPGFDELAPHAFLTDRMEGRVHIENDVNLAALGELTQISADQTDRDFAAISVGTGIGLGMVVGGDLYRGGTGSAGEVGSLLLSLPAPNAVPVTLEDVASAPSIRKLFGQAIEDGQRSNLDPSADVPAIFQAAKTGDQAAQTVLHKTAGAMALAVSHLCLIADPERVVFGGGVGSNPVFVDAVRQHLEELIDSPPELTPSTLGRRAALVGAVSVSLRSMHETLVPEILGDQRR